MGSKKRGHYCKACGKYLAKNLTGRVTVNMYVKIVKGKVESHNQNQLPIMIENCISYQKLLKTV